MRISGEFVCEHWDLKVGTHWATCHDDTSQRQIASFARENFCENLCLRNRILSQHHVIKNEIKQNLCDLL